MPRQQKAITRQYTRIFSRHIEGLAVPKRLRCTPHHLFVGGNAVDCSTAPTSAGLSSEPAFPVFTPGSITGGFHLGKIVSRLAQGEIHRAALRSDHDPAHSVTLMLAMAKGFGKDPVSSRLR